MSVLDHARRRIAAVLKEIERLKQSEFPYTQSLDALLEVEKIFKDQAKMLKRILPSSDPDVIPLIVSAASTSLEYLITYVPILGLILRSTNVRNAFEIHPPLLSLARDILDPEADFIVSSEWEFSPFTYKPIAELQGFVLIGLPAPESGNPLLVPLAGHELGHSVWAAEEFSDRFDQRIGQAVLNEFTTKRWVEYSSLYKWNKQDLLNGHLFAHMTWEPAYTWAMMQIEEIFCDCFGLRVFAESYLHAFEYLVAPNIHFQQRVSHLISAAEAKGIDIPSDFASVFCASATPTDPGIKLLKSVAEDVSSSVVQELIDLAWNFADNKEIPTRSPEHVKGICGQFRLNIAPTSEALPLVDILNAGWECQQGRNLWKKIPNIRRERDRILTDLMLNSMEVWEIHQYRNKRS